MKKTYSLKSLKEDINNLENIYYNKKEIKFIKNIINDLEKYEKLITNNKKYLKEK